MNADGPGDTYELINSVLAPQGNVVEVPDCAHESYGRHISEEFDDELGIYVFRFDIHKDEDNDRCKNFDRQRNEIKTYDKSPDDLLGVLGETVTYSWKFKLAEDFKPSSSFTHLHQIKAVGGSEDAMPSITLTARKGSPDNLELRFAEDFTQKTLVKFPLDAMRGKWLQVTSEVHYGDWGEGSYSVTITSIADNTVVFEYENNALRMWKTNASFMRPKWGIYRSLNDQSSLQDESVFFADFMITEAGNTVLSSESQNSQIYPSAANDTIWLSDQFMVKYDQVSIIDQNGRLLKTQKPTYHLDVSWLKPGLYLLRATHSDGKYEIFKFLKN